MNSCFIAFLDYFKVSVSLYWNNLVISAVEVSLSIKVGDIDSLKGCKVCYFYMLAADLCSVHIRCMGSLLINGLFGLKTLECSQKNPKCASI